MCAVTFEVQITTDQILYKDDRNLIHGLSNSCMLKYYGFEFVSFLNVS